MSLNASASSSDIGSRLRALGRGKLSLWLFLAGLLIALAAASFQAVPGYMDAEYYYAGGLRIVEGGGASEPYLWNYLGSPQSLPVPAFAYWMPLTSIVAAAGLALLKNFWGARLGFILLAALVPPLTARLALRLTGRPWHARLAGLLALFPGFYLAYQTTTDVFPVYMLLGGLFILLSFGPFRWRGVDWPQEARLFVLGLLAGLLHMARADGLLWLIAGAGVAAFWYWGERKRAAADGMGRLWLRLLGCLAALLAGYILVTWPWYTRNLQTMGSLFPPGGSRALWLTSYEETMIYPADRLTPQHWLSAGGAAHLQARWEAFSANLQTTLSVQWAIVLAPFILAATWKLRACSPVRLGAGMWLLTFGVMTVVFPYAGVNGSFFHSGAALQPLFWALAPLGIETVMNGYARLRRLPDASKLITFTSALVVLALALVSVLLFTRRVYGSSPADAWDARHQHYQAVEQVLLAGGATPCETVMVNNPPGYWLVSRRPAVVVPFSDVAGLIAAARQYEVRYLVLELTNPWPLRSLYELKEVPPELEYITTIGSTRVFRLAEEGQEGR